MTRVGTRSRTIEFECRVVCRGRPDRVGESAAEVLDPPIVAVTATGTVVVPPLATRCDRRPVTGVAVCADVGSTFTKVAVVDLADGALLATAAHRTTVDTDVLHGLDAAVAAALAAAGSLTSPTTYVCSSAGGGLRLAVVGYEQLVTAEAGHRVGLSRRGPGRARRRRPARRRRRRPRCAAARPDVVLLVGGTDGGDAEVLRHNAARLGRDPAAGAGGGGRQRRRPRRGRWPR